jgi:hypothetical protein
MNRFDQHWQKLTALARQAPVDRSAIAPPGFATRIVARAAGLTPLSPWAAFERFALRGLMVAAACGLAAIAFNYYLLPTENADDYAATDAVGEILDLS